MTKPYLPPRRIGDYVQDELFTIERTALPLAKLQRWSPTERTQWKAITKTILQLLTVEQLDRLNQTLTTEQWEMLQRHSLTT